MLWVEIELLESWLPADLATRIFFSSPRPNRLWDPPNPLTNFVFSEDKAAGALILPLTPFLSNA
jgi:hypothetical protein